MRSRAERCPATVIQSGPDFIPGTRAHSHAGKPGAIVAAKIKQQVYFIIKHVDYVFILFIIPTFQ